MRRDGSTPRVVRVGTHAVSARSRTTLWQRLKQHKGKGGVGVVDGGNHRGSVFRRHVGTALIGAGRAVVDASETWGRGSVTRRPLRLAEEPLERQVSEIIGDMPFLWLRVPGASGKDNQRARIERGAIGLLTTPDPADPPSASWLGRSAAGSAIRTSGLWNVNHVAGAYDPHFLNELESCVQQGEHQ